MSDQTINPAEDEKYIENCDGFSVAQFAMVARAIAAELLRKLPAYIAKVREQEAEIERLRGLLLGEGVVKKMMYTPEDGIEVELEHWAVKHIAANLANSLGEAPNFVTMTVHHPDEGPIEVTVRRAWGKTVAAVQAELKAEIASLREQVIGPNIPGIMAEGLQTIKDKGLFVDEEDFLRALMMVCEELGEACADYRRNKPLDGIAYGSDGKPEGVPVEIGDAIVRLCAIAAKYDMPLPRAIQEKMAFNKLRGHRFGGKKV